MTTPTPVHKWADLLEASIAEHDVSIVDRVAVFVETLSTQDTARRMAANRPGLLVVTAHQSEGRGRLSRGWTDHPEHSLAMTLALGARDQTSAFLALATGVALADACAGLLPTDTLGLKWPNDLVERTSNRKLAGILVETAGSLALVGIGVNVSHTRAELDAAGLTTATSLAELGGCVDRIGVAEAVAASLDRFLGRPEADLADAWRHRDILTGTHQAFEHNGRRHEGIVESIDPTLTLVIRTREGIQRLPALSTSVVATEAERARTASEGQA
ncbi:MAG: biotin--[acetyl-CoA-carboxylase] ligase [Planctomycetota bacterium]